jgi:hypothetical protein
VEVSGAGQLVFSAAGVPCGVGRFFGGDGEAVQGEGAGCSVHGFSSA